MCDRDRWPIPPYHPDDYWALRELLGPEEFERIVLAHARQPTSRTDSFARDV
jgi:hypothetical protein